MKKITHIAVTDLQLKCHHIANLAKRIEILLKEQHIFVEKSDERRRTTYNVMEGVPVLRPLAEAHIHHLVLLLFGRDRKWAPITDKDVGNLLDAANQYTQILGDIYDEENKAVSALPAEKRNGHFKQLFRRQVIKRPRLHEHPIVRAAIRAR